MNNFPSSNYKFPAWHEVEAQIQKEINWLRQSIETFATNEKYAPVTCRECLMRRIAILIVSGKITAREIKRSPNLKSFWQEIDQKNKNPRTKIFHGSDWHRETMEKIENHFISYGFEVVREPNLHWGRADLGIYKKGNYDLLIEVGTTSFFKLWINLDQMGRFVYLIVPNDDKLIEFTCS